LRLNPNRDADEISHDKPEKQMAILPKNIKKQADLFDFFDGFSVVHRMTEDEDRRYSEQVKRSGVSKINSLGLLLLSVCLQLALILVRCRALRLTHSLASSRLG
jgi:hypothetical protein